MVGAPGWYEAEGDPPGTQRYWDGQIWIGDPVYEPMPAPMPASPTPPPPGVVTPPPAPNASVFRGGVKAIAIVLCVLKALPLALLTIMLFWILAVSNAIENELNEFEGFEGLTFNGLFEFAATVLGGIVVVGAILLLLQFAGALSERPVLLFIPAVIMAVFDFGLAVLAWIGLADAQSRVNGSGSLQVTLLLSAVAAGQIFVAINALRSNTPSTHIAR